MTDDEIYLSHELVEAKARLRASREYAADLAQDILDALEIFEETGELPLSLIRSRAKRIVSRHEL